MNEIRNAINAGKEVITHTDAIQVPGWSGAGYIIIDNDTGSGAYKIAGGVNGGFVKDLKMKAMFFAGLWKSFSKNHPAIAKALGGSIGLIIGTIVTIADLIETCKDKGIAVGISVVLLLWNIIFLGFNVLLAASGVGAFSIFLLAGLEWKLENIFKDKIKSMC